jgi:hypothetical protein
MSRGTVIARGGLALLKSPKTGAVRKILRRNSKVEILEQETWLRVRARDGSEGFVLADFVEPAIEDLFPAEVAQAVRANAARTPARAMRAAVVDAPAASAVCDIRIYRNTQFIGNDLRCDFDFFPCLDRVNRFAVDCGVEVFVTSSTREPGRTVRGAIVPPASKSNHLVGHAIDMNLKSASGAFNSQALTRANRANLPPEIRRFLDLVRNDGELRWGGDFTPDDPVHIDDGLNRTDPARWDSKLASRA